MAKWGLWLLLLCGIVVAAAAMSTNAYASTPDFVFANPENICKEKPANATDPPIEYRGFSEKIVRCIQDILVSVVQHSLSDFHQSLAETVSIILVIFVMFLATRYIMQGVQDIRTEFYFGIFMILGVIYFVIEGGILDYLGVFIETQHQFADMVSRSVDYSAANICAGEDMNVWRRADCIMFSFLNFLDFENGSLVKDEFEKFNFDQAGPSNNSMAIFTMMVGSIALTGLGPIIFLLGGTIIITMLLAVAQAMMIYVISLFAISFLALIAPIIIPMVLFQRTRKMFSQWFEQLISYIIQPTVILAYLALIFNLVGFIVSDCIHGAQKPDGMCNWLRYARDVDTSEEFEYYAKGFVQRAVKKMETGDAITKAQQGNVPNDPTVQHGVVLWGLVLDENPDENMVKFMQAATELLAILLVWMMARAFLKDVMDFGTVITGLIASNAVGSTGMIEQVQQKLVREMRIG